MSKPKVTLRFDVDPEEKEHLEVICKKLNTTKIGFLRMSMDNAEKGKNTND